MASGETGVHTQYNPRPGVIRTGIKDGGATHIHPVITLLAGGWGAWQRVLDLSGFECDVAPLDPPHAIRLLDEEKGERIPLKDDKQPYWNPLTCNDKWGIWIHGGTVQQLFGLGTGLQSG